MKDDAKGYLFDTTEDVEFLEVLDKKESDITITKLRDSAFHATILEQVLAEHHVDTVVLAGVSTQTCVGQTAADAYARNLRVVLVDDAIGTHDKTYHQPTLAMLAKEYRQPRMTVTDIMKQLQPAGPRGKSNE
jgi:nicotinamidase-related amidase